ncbi:MAG: hypothetical protein K1X72_07985 [Pyrinomonadaceae bacterium]|nr:hypothetical protein [Pyrinomonadaceae bacterium]
MNEEFPKNLLRDVYWSFGGKVFENQAEFSEKVRQYQIDIKEKDDWQPEKVVLESSAINLIYEFWEDDDEIEKVVEINADNGESFTAGELLFKIHNLVVDDLRGMDRHFFEGLSLDKPPTFWLNLGS